MTTAGMLESLIIKVGAVTGDDKAWKVTAEVGG